MTNAPKIDEDGTAEGFVKKINIATGYGFIKSQAIPVDIFFHRSIHKYQHLKHGDRVTFGYVRMRDGRYRATRIITVEG